jgi:hypothetical protein
MARAQVLDRGGEILFRLDRREGVALGLQLGETGLEPFALSGS